jgi:hypothetical protein
MKSKYYPIYLLFLLQFLILIPPRSIAQNKYITGFAVPEIAFKIEQKSLFPEGIAYDSKTKQFFLSSLAKFKIVAIDRSGKQYDFIQSRQDSMLRSVSLKVDEKRRRLWVISNSDWGDSVVSAIHIYDIDKKQLINKMFTPKGQTLIFNDLILNNEGDAFIVDYEGNSLYKMTSSLGEIQPLLKSDLFLAGANGIAISPDNTTLYVSTTSRGIVLIDVITKKIRPIENPLSVDINGLDGIFFYKNSLVAIMCKDETSSEPMIIRYQLNLFGNEIIGATILDHKNPLFSVPTNGVMVGDVYYCLAATFLHLFTLAENDEDEKLGNPIVLKYKLSQK